MCLHTSKLFVCLLNAAFWWRDSGQSSAKTQVLTLNVFNPYSDKHKSMRMSEKREMERERQEREGPKHVTQASSHVEPAWTSHCLHMRRLLSPPYPFTVIAAQPPHMHMPPHTHTHTHSGRPQELIDHSKNQQSTINNRDLWILIFSWLDASSWASAPAPKRLNPTG